MKLQTWISIILTLAMIIIIILMILIVGQRLTSEEFQENIQLNYDKCCNGNPCSDTYYSKEDNKCHFVTPYNPFFTQWYITIPIIIGVAIILVLITKYIIPKATYEVREK